MAGSILVDSGFLVALLNRHDSNHAWASALAMRYPPQWVTCDAVLSETFVLLGASGLPAIAELISRGALSSTFRFSDGGTDILKLMQKYADVPMTFADACLVRMTEIVSDPTLLTTDADFRKYRRLGRKAVPCLLPG